MHWIIALQLEKAIPNPKTFDRPLSEHARTILEFVKAHPGVRAQYIAVELNIKGKDFAIALTILQGKDLIEGKFDLEFDKRKHADDSAIRYFARI